MSAAGWRGLVLRGRSLCQWDGARYVRVFSGRRSFYLRAVLAMSFPTGCVPVWLCDFGDGPIDAPDLMCSGGMVGDGMGGMWFMPVFRGGK